MKRLLEKETIFFAPFFKATARKERWNGRMIVVASVLHKDPRKGGTHFIDRDQLARWIRAARANSSEKVFRTVTYRYSPSSK